MAYTKIPPELIADNSVGITQLNVSDGTNGQALVTDGAGTLSFSTIQGYTNSDVETYLNTSDIYTDPTNDRLGIGTSSPDTPLEVNGIIAGTSTGVDGTFAPVFNSLYSLNTAFYGQIQHSMSQVNTQSGFRFMGGGASNVSGSGGLQKLLDLTRGQTIFYTENSERMRIDSSGKVGITTPGAGYNFSNNAPAQTLQIGAYGDSGTYEVPTLGLYYSTVPLLLSNGYDGTYGTATIGLNKTRTDNASSSFSTPVNGNYQSVGIDFLTGTGDSSIEFRTETGVIAYVNDDVQSLVVNTQATASTANKFGLISRGGMTSEVAEGGSGGATLTYGSGPNRHISFSYANGNQSYAHSIATRHNDGYRGNNTIDFYIWDPSLAESAVASDRAISIHNGALELVPITTTQRDGFNANNHAYDGMILYNETEGKFQGRSNSQWINFKTEDDYPVTSGLYFRYTADSFTYNGTSTPPSWADTSGNNRTISTTSTSTGGGFWGHNQASSYWPTLETNSSNTNGANNEFKCVRFSNAQGLALPDDPNIAANATGFSFAYVVRYSGITRKRILQGGGGANNLIGFWDGDRGVFYDGSWLIGPGTQHSTDQDDWCIIVMRSTFLTSKTKDNNSGNFVENTLTHNYSNANYSASSFRYGINAGTYATAPLGTTSSEQSTFDIAEIAFWNRDLTDAEIDSVQSFLETKYGI